MIDLRTFDATTVEPMGSMEPVPAGKYRAAIVKSEEKATKAGDGSYLELTWEIIAGDHKGRRLWSRLNLNNRNSTAVEIARRELSSICHAVGVLKPQSAQNLHNIPAIIAVKLKKREDTGEPSNEIGGYESVETASQSSFNAPPSNKAPWER